MLIEYYSKIYSAKEIQDMLVSFAKGIETKRYSHRIPYSIWVIISNAPDVLITMEGDHLIISSSDCCCSLYDDYVQNNGFARFFYNNYLLPNDEQEKGNDTMSTMPAINFDFGPCNDNIAISPYGLAVKTKDGHFLTYDAKNAKTIDVSGFTFNFKNMIYKMPAAIKDLRPGAMVLHQGKPMYVTNVENGIEVVDVLASEAKTILPVSNMFGFDYVTTIVSFMNLGTTTPTSDNPFGNLMPFMMAQMVFSDGDNGFGEMDMGKMMMFSMMTGQQNPFASFLNPINS